MVFGGEYTIVGPRVSAGTIPTTDLSLEVHSDLQLNFAGKIRLTRGLLLSPGIEIYLFGRYLLRYENRKCFQ